MNTPVKKDRLYISSIVDWNWKTNDQIVQLSKLFDSNPRISVTSLGDVPSIEVHVASIDDLTDFYKAFESFLKTDRSIRSLLKNSRSDRSMTR